ncbi:MAG: hypothetical protein QOG73_1882, partial [Acetobacteraceae bacterium]|nr:hypothetical protein [Acetobacteraceae bacterium]
QRSAHRFHLATVMKSAYSANPTRTNIFSKFDSESSLFNRTFRTHSGIFNGIV